MGNFEEPTDTLEPQDTLVEEWHDDADYEFFMETENEPECVITADALRANGIRCKIGKQVDELHYRKSHFRVYVHKDDMCDAVAFSQQPAAGGSVDDNLEAAIEASHDRARWMVRAMIAVVILFGLLGALLMLGQ